MTATAARPEAASGHVELRELRRCFGAVKALDGFSLDIADGELVALLGPSGCGKTTALRALSGLEDVDSGTILVGGKDITDRPANRRNMAMVFQSYSLFPHLTVAANIDFALELRKVSGDRRRAVMESLELVGLSAQADRYPNQLSGGQQQRVALARALAVRPQVLLLDEPLSALDAKVRMQLREEIRRLQRDLGITTLFVTHDQEEALAVADRVGVMNSGQLIQIGTPEEIYRRPASGFVADFIGRTNRLPCRVVGDGAEVLGQTVPLLAGSVQGEATLLVRPEDVALLRTDTAAPQGAGEVVLTAFLGPYARVQVRTSDGVLLVAQVAAGDAAGLGLGDAVEVSLRAVPALAV